MAVLVASPDWYKGITILLEVFAMLVAMGVVYAGTHAFRVTKDKKHLFFAIAFGLITLSFAGRLFTELTIAIESFNQNIVMPVASSIGVSQNLFNLGHVVYVWLLLTAYSLLLGLALKWDRKREYGVLIALATIIAAASVAVSWPFYLASLALLFCIALQHFLNFKERKARSAYWIFFAFALLTLEPLMYLLSDFLPALIAAGYVIRLIAYVVIFRTIWKVLADE